MSSLKKIITGNASFKKTKKVVESFFKIILTTKNAVYGENYH